jgi:hypothetical protein
MAPDRSRVLPCNGRSVGVVGKLELSGTIGVIVITGHLAPFAQSFRIDG